MRASLVVVCVCACGGGGNAPNATLDGAIERDAPPVAPDATIDAPPASPFTFVPPAVDFGYVSPGTNSALIHLVVNNSGPPVSGFSLQLSGDDAAEFVISQSTCESMLVDGCDMQVDFRPAAEGEHTMTLTAMAPGQVSATASIHAIGGTAPSPFYPDPDESVLDFGVVTVGNQSGQVVTYKNHGTTTLPPVSFQFAGESPNQYHLANDQCSGVALTAGATCTVTVLYEPTDVMVPGTAILYGTASNTNELDLRGDGGNATTIAISSATTDFGTVQAPNSQTIPFVVTNTGSVAATGIGLMFPMHDTDYSIGSSTCGAPVPPGLSCVLDVRFDPTATGPDGGGMRVIGSNTNEADASWTAIAIPAEGVILDTWGPVDLGSATVGQVGGSHTFTVTNVGTQPATITTSFDNAGYQFEVVADGCTGTPLAAQATCPITVAFAPQDQYAGFARIHVTTATNDAIASLTGHPIAPDQPLACGGYDFRTLAVGQIVTQPMQCVNEGFVVKTPTALTITGPNATEFVIDHDTCIGVPLAKGDACTFNVHTKFLTVGDKTATLSVTWDQGTASGTLTGTAFQVQGPYINSDPVAIDFGTVPVGQPSAPQTFPFTNYGTDSSMPIFFTFSEPTYGFSLTNDTCTGVALAPNDSCSVDVIFTPPSTGAKNSWLDVAVPGGSSEHLTGIGN